LLFLAALIAAVPTSTGARASLGVSVKDTALGVEPGAVLGRTGLVVVDAQLSETLWVGDVVVAIDRRPVVTRDDLERALADRRPGDRVTVTIERDAERIDLETVLAASLESSPTPTPTPSAEPPGFARAETMTFIKDPEPHWYGWQIIPFDLGMIGLTIAAAYVGDAAGVALFSGAIASYLVPSPLIHLAHRNDKGALYSLGARLFVPLIVSGVAGASDIAFSARDDSGSFAVRIGSGGVIALTFILVAMVVDSTVIAVEKPRREELE
jgi:hypothetical protein